MMSTNNLESFILKNREQFDLASPREDGWTAIEQALNNQEKDCETIEGFIASNRESFNTATPSDHIWMKIEKGIEAQQPSSQLESFIQRNRDHFDEAVPSFRVWAAIDKNMHPGEKQRAVRVVSVWRSLRVAVAVLLLLTAGAVVGIYFTKSQANPAVASLKDISPEYAEMAQYYDTQIEEKVQQVSVQSADKSVLEDLKMIDQSMAELEAELQKAPKGAEEQIVANLIKSYQIKLDILERVLERIQSVKKDSTKQKLEDDEISI